MIVRAHSVLPGGHSQRAPDLPESFCLVRKMFGLSTVGHCQRLFWHRFMVTVSNTSSAALLPFVHRPGTSRFHVAVVALAPFFLLGSMLTLRVNLSRRLAVRVVTTVGLAIFMATWLLASGCGGGVAPPTNATLTIAGTSGRADPLAPVVSDDRPLRRTTRQLQFSGSSANGLAVSMQSFFRLAAAILRPRGRLLETRISPSFFALAPELRIPGLCPTYWDLSVPR